MTTPEKITTVVFALIMLGIIFANYYNNRTLWRWCYRCLTWHNELGERQKKAPLRGRLGGSCLCKRCHIEVRGV